MALDVFRVDKVYFFSSTDTFSLPIFCSNRAKIGKAWQSL